jgi:hypothetical protein
MRLKHAALAGVASTLLMCATAASASASYCNRSTCDLSTGPSTSGIYFQMPSGTAITMLCWTDNQWYLGTNRWFKISTIYGTGYTSAAEVSAQTSVGHC